MAQRTAAHTAGGVEDAVSARLDAAGLWALNGPGPLDVRTGIVYAPGSPMQVLGTSATSPWTVTVNPGHVVGSKGSSNGPYYAANDALVTVALTAPPASNSRTDTIYAMQLDSAAIVSPDGSTAAVLAVAIGAPSATPTPGVPPVGAVSLYTVNILSTATAGTSGAGVTIAPVANWTSTRGTPIPVRNQAERDAITVYDGLQVYRLDLHATETYNAGTAGWLRSSPVGGGAKQTYMSANNTFTNPTVWAPLPVDNTAATLTYIKQSSATRLLIYVRATLELSSGVAQLIHVGANVNGTTTEAGSTPYVTAVSRDSIDGIVSVTGIAAGTVTIAPMIMAGASAITMYSGLDSVIVSVTECP